MQLVVAWAMGTGLGVLVMLAVLMALESPSDELIRLRQEVAVLTDLLQESEANLLITASNHEASLEKSRELPPPNRPMPTPLASDVTEDARQLVEELRGEHMLRKFGESYSILGPGEMTVTIFDGSGGIASVLVSGDYSDPDAFQEVLDRVIPRVLMSPLSHDDDAWINAAMPLVAAARDATSHSRTVGDCQIEVSKIPGDKGVVVRVAAPKRRVAIPLREA